jgi:hypothetical protein
MEHPTVTETDIELIHQSRTRNRYADFSDAERDAHTRVHEVLRQLGAIAVEELGGARDYSLKLTSGFHPRSGVRGAKPKDLWFGVYRKENEEPFLANPQIFMIVSQRGVEWGFSPLTHPDDFSNQDIKRRTRKIARDVLEQLPVPGSPEAKKLAVQLAETGDWYFRRKQRLDPKQSERPSLDDWLSYERSDEGVQNAGGGITRYALPEEVSKINFSDEIRQIALLFKPLMEKIVANAPPATAADDLDLSSHRDLSVPAFDNLLRTFLREFANARKGPFQKSNPLWNAMSDVKTRIEMFPAVRNRSDLLVSISVGQGDWASVPWIALLNTSVTRSTQEGIYIVFLISHDLGRIFLALIQGTTNLVRELGQREAQKRMLDVANKTRMLIPGLEAQGFALDNEIALGGSGWLAKNYEIGTIAHINFDVNDVPPDDRINELLKAALDAYDRGLMYRLPSRSLSRLLERIRRQLLSLMEWMKHFQSFSSNRKYLSAFSQFGVEKRT